MKYVTDVQTIELGKMEQTSKAGKAGWGGAGDRRVRTIAKASAPRILDGSSHKSTRSKVQAGTATLKNMQKHTQKNEPSYTNTCRSLQGGGPSHQSIHNAQMEAHKPVGWAEDLR